MAIPVVGLAGGHAAVRVRNSDGGYNYVGELLNVSGTNDIVTWPGDAAKADDYVWVTVPTPEGMTSEEFDIAVTNSFFTLAPIREGQPYSSHSAVNSNRFIFDVITGAGGSMPLGVTGTGRVAPGICGGSPKNRFAVGTGCK